MATTAGLQPEFKERLEALLAEAGPRLVLNYGYRSRAEQQKLYDLWLAGKGSPANRPGTSLHEKGLAADVANVGDDPKELADNAILRAQLANKYGFVQPYAAKEPWHLELDPNRQPLTKEQVMNLVIEPVGAVDRPQSDGFWAFGARGHVYAMGAARHLGAWDDLTRNDPNRRCVALVPTESGNGYWLVSSAGEVYAYGDAPQTGNYRSKDWGAGLIIGAFRNDLQTNGGVTLVRDDGINLNPYALPT